MLQFALESVKIWRSEGMELDFVQKLQFLLLRRIRARIDQRSINNIKLILTSNYGKILMHYFITK